MHIHGTRSDELACLVFATYVGTYRQVGAALHGVLLFRGFFERGPLFIGMQWFRGCSYYSAVIQGMQLFRRCSYIQGVQLFRGCCHSDIFFGCSGTGC